MSKLLTRTKSSVAAKKLAQSLGGKFEPAQTSVAGTVVGANLVSVGGQQYRSVGVDGDAGASVALRNIGTPAVAVYGPATGGAALASVGSNGGNSGSGGDHNPVALATPSGLQFADTLTQIGLALALPSSLGASSINAVGASHSHAIDDTIARSAITLTAGDGLSGLGNLTANRTVAIELSATSGLELTGTSPDKTLQLADSVAGDGLTIASKVLAIGVSGLGLSVGASAVTLASSSSPGAAASILASSAAGALTLPLITATTSVATPLLTTTSGDLTIDPVGVVKFPVAQTLKSADFDSDFPILGWQINEVIGITGQSALTIGRIAADELSVKVFVADETRVDRANQYWTRSYGIVAESFVTPSAIGGTVTITFEDSPAAAGAIFSVNDWILFRIIDTTSGLEVASVWGQVSNHTALPEDPELGVTLQSWTFTLRSGPTNTTIKAGRTAIDFGASGAALIHLSVLDAAGAPYIKMRKWAGANPYTPANFTTYVQIGELASVSSASLPYAPSGNGLYVRSGNSAGNAIVVDDTGLLIQGADFRMYNGANQTVNISSTGESFWLGLSAADKRLHWDGSVLSIVGAITANTGYIGTAATGWAIAAGQLTSTNIGLYAGASARLQVGANSDIAGVAATSVAADVAFWAGDTYANRTAAEFRVTAGGAFYATTGTIAGDFSVTGSGKLSASGGGIVMTATGINVGLYPNIDGGATPSGESKALAWYDAPSTATGLQARQYVGKANDGTPHWNVTVGPSVASPLTMSLWYGGSTLNGLWFTNLAQVSGLPALFLAKGTPETAQIRDGAQLQLNAGSTFLAYAHLKAGTTNTYDIGEAGVKWKTLYVGNIVADTISGTSLSGATWRNDASDMGIYSSAAGTRILTIANDGAGVMNVEIDGSLKIVTGNITLEGSGATVDGVDISAHAANANAHHAQSHVLAGSDHTASGLTAGWVLRASAATTFAWAQLAHSDLSGVGTNSHATIDSHISATAAHGATGAVVGTTNTQTLSGKTLTTPTIADFTNATHAHTGATSGGTIAHSSTTGRTANDHHNQSHVLATNLALGGDHTISGATAGHVLRASGATTALFAAIADADLPSTIVRTTRQIISGSGLTGGGDLSADRTLVVGAGTLITVGDDTVGLSSGTAQYQVPVTGATPFAPAYTLLSDFAGAGLAFTAGTFAVGAGTMIAVNANDVAVTAGAAYQFVGTGSGTAAGWRNVSELAGDGLTHATGVLAVGVSGLGLSVGADAVTLTSNSNPGAAAAILASTAAGALTLVDLTVTALTASRLVASDGSDKLVSVSALSSWIAGTANRITVADDGDGTITLSAPQDIHTAATPTFGGLIAPWLRPAANSTTALQLQTAGGTSIFNVDTTNSRIGVNKTNPAYSFDITGTGRFTSTLYADDDLVVGDTADITGATILRGNLTVGPAYATPGVLYVNAAGTRVGINCAPDSQFDLDVAGPIRGTYLVGKHAIQLDNAVGVFHFDGPQPFNLDFTGSNASHMGVNGTVTGGVIHRPGKFGKAVQVAETTTNLVLDPSFELGAKTHWVDYYTMGYTYSATGGLYGNGCLIASTTDSGTRNGAYQSIVSLANGIHTLSAWIYIDSFTMQGSFAPSLYLDSYGGADILVQSDKTKIGQWQRITHTFTVTGGPRNVNVYLLCQSACTWRADAVQLEAKAYATSYCDGSLGTGHTWSGTTHASASTRTNGYLRYNLGGVVYPTGTVMMWSKRTSLGDVPQSFFQFADKSASTTTLKLFESSSAGGLLYYNIGNAGEIYAGAPGTVDAWTHYAITWDASNAKLYKNGLLVSTSTLAPGPITIGEFDVGFFSDGGYGSFDGLLDDFVILDYAVEADLIRTIYESDAPVFVASSVFHWRSPARVPIWVDEFGLWAQGVNGGAMLGLYGGDPRNPTGNVTTSWGGVTMSENDLVIGRTTSGGAAIHWDDSESKLRIGVQTNEHIALTGTALQFMNDTTEMAKLDGTTFTLGNTAGSHVAITSTTFDIKYGSTSKISLDASGNASFVGALSIGTGGSIASGATSYAAGTGIWIEYNAGTPRLRIGTTAGNRLTWDGTTLTIAGSGAGITSIDGGNITTGTVTATQIAANTITAAKIAANTITASQIAADTITAGQIAADTITATQIAANAITASEIATGAVTATKISVTNLAAVSASMGALTVDNTLTMATGGVLKSGATAYNSGTGYWLEHNAGTPRFFIGNSAGNKLTWDGSALSITGAITATSGTFTGAINASSGSITGALTMGASGSITAGNVAMNTSGITGTVTTGWNESVAYKFKSGATTIGGLFAYRDTGYTQVTMSANAKPLTAEPYESGQSGRLTLSSISAGAGTTSLSYVSAGNYNTALTVYTEAYMLISAAAGASVTTSIALVAGSLTFNGNAIWHAGNDGVGSGLDADYFDGADSSAYGRLASAASWSAIQTLNAGLRIGGDPGAGSAGQVSLTNSTSGTSTGYGTVKMGGSTYRDSTGWLKIYVAGNAKYIPYWDAV